MSHRRIPFLVLGAAAVVVSLLSTTTTTSANAVSPAERVATAAPAVAKGQPDPFGGRFTPVADPHWTTLPDAGDRPARRAPGVTAARKPPLDEYSCGGWRKFPPRIENPTYVYYFSTCARFDKVKRRFEQDYATDTVNRGSQTLQWTCIHERTTTWEYSVTVAVETEVGAIFAKAKASISGTVAKRTTSLERSQNAYPIKPRRKAYCLRGTFTYSVAGDVRKRAKIRNTKTGEVQIGWWEDAKRYRGKIPSYTRHIFGDGPVPH